MHQIEAIGLGAVGVLAVMWIKSRTASHQVIKEAIPANSSDFQGSMWTVLNGADMPPYSGAEHAQMTGGGVGVSKAEAKLFELNAMVKPMRNSQNRNLDGATTADPGYIGRTNLGLAPSWNGCL